MKHSVIRLVASCVLTTVMCITADPAAFADVVVLRDGTRYTGVLKDSGTTGVSFERIETVTIPATRIKSLVETGTRDESFYVIPAPKQASYTGEDCRLSMRTVIFYDSASTGSLAAAQALSAILGRSGLKQVSAVPLKVSLDPSRSGACVIFITDKHPGVKAQHGDEAYHLRVERRHITIEGASARGAFYGVQTLAQLIKGDARYGLSARGCDITDWPDTPVRICNLPRLTHKSDLALFRRYAELLARYKYNTLLLENSGAIKLDQHPEAWRADGFPKDEIRALLTDFRKLQFDVIPLFNSFGHVNEWLGTEPGEKEKYHLEELVENPRTLATLTPGTTRTYELLFSVYDEMTDLFGEPRFFHTGMDEAERFSFGQNPASRGRDPATLYAQHLNTIGEYFAKRGMTMMIWGDLLCDPQKFPDEDSSNGGRPTYFAHALDKLKVKPIIIDWHYETANPTPSAEYFKSLGYNTYVAPWKSPVNTYGHAKSLRKLGLEGICATMWNFFDRGYDPMKELEPNGAPILTSEYAWNHKAPAPEGLAWKPEAEFARQWKKH